MAVRRNLRMLCDSNEGEGKCVLYGSIRGSNVAFYTEGGDEWPHLTVKQVIKLRDFLDGALNLLECRRPREQVKMLPEALEYDD